MAKTYIELNDEPKFLQLKKYLGVDEIDKIYVINYDIYTPYYHTKNHITDLQKNEDIETKAIIREDVINENYLILKRFILFI